MEDCFTKEITDEKGDVVRTEITGDLVMFITRKENISYLDDELLSPQRRSKTIRRRHILERTDSCASMSKSRLNLEDNNSSSKQYPSTEA